jgi:acetyl-CoA acetyltransferase
MRFENVFIPYGGYWSTPFVRWQGSFAHLHPILFAAEITRNALQARGLAAGQFDALFLGMTVPQKHAFYGAPWLAALIGAPELTGPLLAQACATSARVLASAALEVETGHQQAVLALTTDRTSNGPHIYYPNPLAPGGRGETEEWVWENFNYDPYAGNAMIQTAENVARESDISKEQQDDLMLLRCAQYQDALKDDASFHRRYMVKPVEVKDVAGRKVTAVVQDDEGVFPTTRDGLAKLKPVLEGGTVTFGGQTYPADGNAGMVVTTRERALEMSGGRGIPVQLISFGTARAKKGFMPQAPVPAAQRALQQAGLEISDLRAIKTHNPFAVNDIYFSEQMGVPVESMNRFGSSLVFGHPQAPTGMRLMIELVEELTLAGGGYGLFTGCAAGDTAMAWIVQVG